MDKVELALQLSEEILAGIETDSLSTSAAALRCLRLARLLSDAPAIEWFQYETAGYPRISEGYIESQAFSVACAHGRGVLPTEEGDRRIFTELADELEASIQTTQKAISTLTTQGVSVAGERAAIAMRELRQNVTAQTNAFLKIIKESQRRLTILRGSYYSYALSINLELKFSQRAEEVFHLYRLSVDRLLARLTPDSLKRLDAAYERLSSTNSESWAQAVTSCRRVLQEVSDALFTDSEYSEYTTKSGKVLDVSGDHYLNRLFACVDKLATSSTSRRLVGSNVMYVVDMIDNLHDLLNRGVHDLVDRLTYDEARAAVLHTYILLGDIASLVLRESCDHIAEDRAA
jgi:hypothetical protein